MNDPKVLGILAGDDIPQAVLVAWFHSADVVIAADGAANRLLRAGLVPNLVVGDLDSLDETLRQQTTVLHDKDQETTDCDKLLDYIRDHFPSSQVSIIGIEGDRFDHVLSSMQSIARLMPNARLILRDGFAWFASGSRSLGIETLAGQTVSLVPILECSGVKMVGVQWAPQTTLSPIGATSISNQTNSKKVTVGMSSGLAILILQTSVAIPRWN